MSDPARLKQRALAFVLTIGALSFFADFTYEGSRSVLGPWLEMLGASALAKGVAERARTYEVLRNHATEGASDHYPLMGTFAVD